MTKPKELIAKWPLDKNFNLEGCNCIQHAKIVTFEITFEVLKDRWKIFGHFARYSWFATTIQLKAAMLRVNTIDFFLSDVHKSRVLFPDKRSTFVLDHQHGRHDVMCKPAIENQQDTPMGNSRE